MHDISQNYGEESNHNHGMSKYNNLQSQWYSHGLTLKMLVAIIDAQWERMGDVGSTRYELALLPPCPTISVLSYSN